MTARRPGPFLKEAQNGKKVMYRREWSAKLEKKIPQVSGTQVCSKNEYTENEEY